VPTPRSAPLWSLTVVLVKDVIWFIKKPQRSRGRLFFYVPKKYYDVVNPDKEYILIVVPADRIDILNVLSNLKESESEKVA